MSSPLSSGSTSPVHLAAPSSPSSPHSVGLRDRLESETHALNFVKANLTFLFSLLFNIDPTDEAQSHAITASQLDMLGFLFNGGTTHLLQYPSLSAAYPKWQDSQPPHQAAPIVISSVSKATVIKRAEEFAANCDVTIHGCHDTYIYVLGPLRHSGLAYVRHSTGQWNKFINLDTEGRLLLPADIFGVVDTVARFPSLVEREGTVHADDVVLQSPLHFTEVCVPDPPFALPPDFALAVRKMQDNVDGLRRLIASDEFDAPTKKLLEQAIQVKFKEWLATSGNTRQVLDLVQLEKARHLGAIAIITTSAFRAHASSTERTQKVNELLFRNKSGTLLPSDVMDSVIGSPADDGQVGNPKTSSLPMFPECAQLDYQSKNGKIVAVTKNGTEVAISIKGSILRNTKPAKSLVNVESNRALDLTNYMTMLQSIIKVLAFRRIGVLISLHTLTTMQSGGNWYSDALGVSKADFLEAVDILTQSLCTNEYWNVMGLDAKNEPHEATWAEFAEGATIIGNRMLEGCPNWSIYVEGVNDGTKSVTIDGTAFKYFDWWGGGLQQARANPVTLQTPHKVVYAPHYYNTGVFPQPYLYGPGGVRDELDDQTLKRRIQGTSFDMFGHVNKRQTDAVVMGEFAGLYATDAHPLKTTKRVTDLLIEIMLEEKYAGGFMWSLNPESAYQYNPSPGHYTEGLLLDDWLTPNAVFLKGLAAMDAFPDLRMLPCVPTTSA
ncbi:hypothetical protein DYB32_001624 [Aphanomyces invadans]|uniref:Glycoside hydrolase family 5 domain-containing protein n=1 Tax=Aphanomyces invadans TaxID=157072 RepID=A0A3R7D5C1_9STRA|nr:hypothetical protein DYB32_001624 [Aphanomyces invadans]